jgi:hypothetical protein
MTYQQAAQTALDVQDAVNLSGVTHAFSQAVSAIWDEAHRTGQGTEFVNTHPIVALFLSKLTDLNRHAPYFPACKEVESIAKREAVSHG